MNRLACLLFLAAAAGLGPIQRAVAQTQYQWIGPVGAEADYDAGDLGGGEATNWYNPGPPEAFLQPDSFFDEYGSISNGGIALIDHGISISPADLRIAETAGSTGGLTIRTGGAITVQAEAFGTGTLANGGGGAGTLTLRDDMGAVSVERYTQNAASTLVAQVSGAATFANRITASNAISLDGTLRVERAPDSNFTAAAGNSWTIMQGPAITGSFDAVEVDPNLRGNAGQVFATSRSGGALTVSVEQRLVVQVDRFTGAATLMNPSGHAVNIPLISYTLASPGNGVSGANGRWNSLQDAGVSGWEEANPTAAQLSELNATGTLTITPGQARDLGTPINANAGAPLGTDPVQVADVSFRYQSPTGELVDAVIEPVGRINDLVLVVDPANGLATIQNQSAQSVSFIGYTVSSAAGALNPAFSGFEGASVADWFKANPTTFNLTELNTHSVAAMAPGDEQALGTAWDFNSDDRDLEFQYQTADGVLHAGTVYYGDKAVIAAENADFDSSGTVDGRDFLTWQRGFGLTGQSDKTTGDANGDGNVDASDLTAWTAQFGTSPAAVATVAGVPEPSTALLTVVALTCLARATVRRCMDAD